MSLSNSAPNGALTMESAKSAVLSEEMRRKSLGSSSHSEVLVTESRGRSQRRTQNNHGAPRGKSQNQASDSRGKSRGGSNK